MSKEIMIAVGFSGAGLLVAWLFLREYRSEDKRGSAGRLGKAASLMFVLWALSGALLPWAGQLSIPFLPRVDTMLGIGAVVVGALALRQAVLAKGESE